MSRRAASRAAVAVPRREGLRYMAASALAPRTVENYARAVRAFVRWTESYDYKARSVEELDGLVTDYIHLIFEVRGGTGKGTAAALLNGLVKLMPELAARLPLARAAVRAFERLQPPVAHPPLTLSCAMVIAFAIGLTSYRAGLGTVVGFHGMLRVGELVRLTAADVITAGDARAPLPPGMQAGVILRLRMTKTGRGRDRIQEVAIEDAAVSALLADLARRTPSSSRLFGCPSDVDYRRLFRAAVEALGLPASLTPHSLRHGGATYLSARGVSVPDIMRRGRWASDRTARHYIQHLRARLHEVAVPDEIAAAGWWLASNAAMAFSALSQLRSATAAARRRDGGGVLSA